MRKWTVALLAAACTWVGWTQSHKLSDTLPPCGGMALLSRENYLVVHDLKEHQPGARFGLVNTEGGVHYSPVETDWSAVGEPANDLESVCPLDGAPGHFLAAESGYYQGKYGRVYWMFYEDNKLKTISKFQLPRVPQDIEGIATKRLERERWLVLLGGRGGRHHETGRLFWGVLDRSQGAVEWPKEGLEGSELQLPRRMGPYARTLSDMFLDEHGQLWVSTCSTPGPAGPYRSLIFQAGEVKPNVKTPFERARETQQVWWIDGLKIEGVAPCSRPGYGPAYCTDDDALDGIWRAVPAQPSLGY